MQSVPYIGADLDDRDLRTHSPAGWYKMNVSADSIPGIFKLSVVPLLLIAFPSEAQRPSMVGTVLDQMTLMPIAGATVSVVDREWVQTSDRNGNFLFDGLDTGEFTMRVNADGYSASVDQVTLVEDEIGFVQVQLLPVAAVLDEVLILAGALRSESIAEATPEKSRDARTALDLLEHQVAGLQLQRSGNMGDRVYVAVRGVKTLIGNNAPSIYLDGIRMGGGAADFAILDELPADQIRRIRVLKGPSAEARYAESANGIILIETVRGRSK